MSRTLFKLVSFLFSSFYFHRADYSEPIYHFLTRIGWSGILREGLSQLTFLAAAEKSLVTPRLVRFEVSSLCNLKCLMCPQPDKMTRPRKNMPYDLYRRVIDANPQIREVELFNWGEPLMNPRLVEFVRYAAKNKILTRFVTNATLLNGNKSSELVAAGLDEIYFSLDNIDDEYERIRKQSFARVIENITGFIEMARNGPKHIRTGVNIVKSQYNKNGLDQAKRRFMKMGIDVVLVEECQFEQEVFSRTSRCFEPYRNITILSNGTVVPCCVDYNGVLAMGSVWQEPNLKKIFNNSAYRGLRRSFRPNNRINSICERCSYRSVAIGY